jgi:hypothetical protein
LVRPMYHRRRLRGSPLIGPASARGRLPFGNPPV